MNEPASHPDDLGRFFVQRANAGDADGVAALYEQGAVLANPAGGAPIAGRDEIRAAYRRLLADRPSFSGGRQRSALVSGDIALTSTLRADGGATAEVARKQPDGSWLWVLDQPDITA